MIGKTIAHYRITAKLGQGGMGEVYRATDTKLNRDVALKFLPDAFARDVERMGRFQREAQVLASLNHPNIAAIYGVEEENGQKVLVMELAEGEDLSERIARGPIPLEEALRIALQIADALEDAHEKNIIHRDLKPANIRITPQGKVKVLDFGLAKALEDEIRPDGFDLSQSPTLSMAATQAGIILGTAAYMSPEQARGQQADKRADIWSFGVLLYELLTGRQLFQESTVSDTMAAVLKVEPDWTAVAHLPATIRRLLSRCLRKEAHKRLRDIGDARISIADYLADPDAAMIPPGQTRRLGGPLAWVLPGLIAGALVTLLVISQLDRPTRLPVSHLTLSLAPSGGLDIGAVYNISGLAISRDGTKIAFSGRASSDPGFISVNPTGIQLFLRELGAASATPMPNTEGAREPAFSPDGKWIAFHDGGFLNKVAVQGGPKIRICDCPQAGDISWGPDNSIVFSGIPTVKVGLWRVSADGGEPESLITDDSNPSGGVFTRPLHMPNGKLLLFDFVFSSAPDIPRIGVLDLESGQGRLLAPEGSLLGYAASGYLLYAVDGTVMAVNLDLETGMISGSPRPVLDKVAHTNSEPKTLHAVVSENGTLVYLPESLVENSAETLFWLDETGATHNLQGPSNRLMDPRLSPDDRRLALSLAFEGADVWVRDLERGSQTRITVDPGEDETPIWDPTGEWLIWAASRGNGDRTLMRRRADGTGVEEVLWNADYHIHASSITPDGKQILVDLIHPETGFDIWVVETESEVQARPLLEAPYDEVFARLSPDGRWLSYMSNESGRDEIYVQPFPSLSQKIQISTEGGREPIWSRDGKRLFYKNEQKLFSVDMRLTGDDLRPALPRSLFEVATAYSKGAGHFSYDVSADGRFIMTLNENAFFPQSIRIVLNWFEEANSP